MDFFFVHNLLIKMHETNDKSEVRMKNSLWQPWLDTDKEDKQTNKQLAGTTATKWKRDKRCLRLPEYTRKSPAVVAVDANKNGGESDEVSNNNSSSSSSSPEQENCATAPLDMSVRQRGLPPSYSQTVNNPGYRSNYRPSVIQNNKDDLPSGFSMCDPIIDEHFRRSLGNDYLSLFSNNNKESIIPVVKTTTTSPPPATASKDTSNVKVATNVIELMDSTGLSVDDHFAKALGDTWTKLNNSKKDTEINKSNGRSSDNGLVTTI